MEYIKINSIKEIDNLKTKKKIYFLSGGTDFMIMYKENMIKEDSIVIDISGLSLDYIKNDKTSIKIGAAATFSSIIKNKLIEKKLPALIAAADSIGSPQIRNRATIGGNIGNASPAGDSIPALYIYNSIIKTNKKKYKISDFFKGVKKSILSNGELIKEIEVPIKSGNYKSFFFKNGAREALAISKASLAVLINVKNSIIKDINIAAGAVGVTVVKCRKTESFLLNKKINNELIENSMEIIKEDIAPITDFRSTKSYRENIIAYYLKSALLSR